MTVNTPHITTTLSERVLHITLNRAEKKNALTRAMYIAIAQHLQDAEANDDVRVVVVSGAGSAFSVGNDIADFIDGPADLSKSPVFAFLETISTFTKPLIAAVHGQVIGVGMTFLLHCDFVVAATSTQASVPFARLGLCPEAASSYLLPALLGYQNAMASFLLGDTLSAERLAQVGLAYQVVPDNELLTAAMTLANRVASLPIAAVMATKKLVKTHSAATIEAALGAEASAFMQLMNSEETQRNFKAFLGRSTPSVNS